MVVRRFVTIALALSGALVSGCVTDSASIYIAGGVAIDSSNCSYAASTSSYTAGSAADVNLGALYGQSVMVGFAVQSLVRQRSFAIATDPSTIVIEEAEIELSDASGAALAGTSSFTVDVAGAVIPGSADGVAPGQGVVAVPVIPAATMVGLAGITTPTQVIAHITLRGRTNGHIDVEGGPFIWIVTLLPAGSRMATCGAGTGVSCCNPGQDGEFYCAAPEAGCASLQ